MEIVVVDDASNRDDPEEVVRQEGLGRVHYLRQRANVGHTRNFQTCLETSRGHVVHLLHADDFVAPGYYKAMRYGLEAGADAAFSASNYINSIGNIIGVSPQLRPAPGPLYEAVELLALEQRIMTPSIVVKRSVYEAIGGFDHTLECSEDWEMWVRIASRFHFWHDPHPLAFYRMHVDSNTGRNMGSAKDMEFTRMAIEMFSEYLPPARRGIIVATALTTYSRTCVSNSLELARARDIAGAIAQLREATRMAPAASVAFDLIRQLARKTVDRP